MPNELIVQEIKGLELHSSLQIWLPKEKSDWVEFCGEWMETIENCIAGIDELGVHFVKGAPRAEVKAWEAVVTLWFTGRLYVERGHRARGPVMFWRNVANESMGFSFFCGLCGGRQSVDFWGFASHPVHVCKNPEGVEWDEWEHLVALVHRQERFIEECWMLLVSMGREKSRDYTADVEYLEEALPSCPGDWLDFKCDGGELGMWGPPRSREDWKTVAEFVKGRTFVGAVDEKRTDMAGVNDLKSWN